MNYSKIKSSQVTWNKKSSNIVNEEHDIIYHVILFPDKKKKCSKIGVIFDGLWNAKS